MAAIRKLAENENVEIDWGLAEEVRASSRSGLQTDIAIGMVRSGKITIISDNGEVRDAKDLVVRIQSHFGRERLDIVPLMDSQARELKVRQPAFAVRLRPLELNEI